LVGEREKNLNNGLALGVGRGRPAHLKEKGIRGSFTKNCLISNFLKRKRRRRERKGKKKGELLAEKSRRRGSFTEGKIQ